MLLEKFTGILDNFNYVKTTYLWYLFSSFGCAINSTEHILSVHLKTLEILPAWQKYLNIEVILISEFDISELRINFTNMEVILISELRNPEIKHLGPLVRMAANRLPAFHFEKAKQNKIDLTTIDTNI